MYEATWKKEMSEGKSAIALLVSSIRGWLPLLVRDIPGFDSSDYADQPSVPDDVLEDAERMETVVETYRDPEGKPLPYAEALLASIDVENAAKEWEEAETADVSYQQMLKDSRETCALFDAEIQTFRKSLAAAIGTNDKDYQKLRASKATTKDEDDDPKAPAPPTPVEPAAPGVTEPVIG
jgi:hypothetical protein